MLTHVRQGISNNLRETGATWHIKLWRLQYFLNVIYTIPNVRDKLINLVCYVKRGPFWILIALYISCGVTYTISSSKKCLEKNKTKQYKTQLLNLVAVPIISPYFVWNKRSNSFDMYHIWWVIFHMSFCPSCIKWF